MLIGLAISSRSRCSAEVLRGPRDHHRPPGLAAIGSAGQVAESPSQAPSGPRSPRAQARIAYGPRPGGQAFNTRWNCDQAHPGGTGTGGGGAGRLQHHSRFEPRGFQEPCDAPEPLAREQLGRHLCAERTAEHLGGTKRVVGGPQRVGRRLLPGRLALIFLIHRG